MGEFVGCGNPYAARFNPCGQVFVDNDGSPSPEPNILGEHAATNGLTGNDGASAFFYVFNLGVVLQQQSMTQYPRPQLEESSIRPRGQKDLPKTSGARSA